MPDIFPTFSSPNKCFSQTCWRDVISIVLPSGTSKQHDQARDQARDNTRIKEVKCKTKCINLIVLHYSSTKFLTFPSMENALVKFPTFS